MRGRVRAEDEARVVRDIQPLVRVGGPGIGALYPFDEIAQTRGSGRPHPERSVDVDPSASLTGGVADGAERVESPGVHIARLGAHYGRPGDLRESCTQGVRPHPALAIRRNRAQVRGSKAKEAQGAVYGDVALLTHDDPDRWCAGEAVGLDVPACRLEHAVSGGGERGEVRHLAAGYEPKGGLSGEPEQLDQPRA